MKYLKIMFIGFCMGSVDVIPGVSGGTMALILGIYERLIDAIRSILSLETLQMLLRGNIKKAWEQIDGTFLVSLVSGIALGIITVARILETLLARYPEQVWAVFFGSVFFSGWIVIKEVKQWSFVRFIALCIAAALAWLFVSSQSITTPDTWWMLLLTGMVASCAMILPGISGAFLLVILGKYQTIVAAVNTADIVTIGLVGGGAIIGITLFAWVLRWLLTNAHDTTFAILAGLLFGSVWRLWPWKTIPLEVQSASIWPTASFITVITCACILLGMSAVYVLYRISRTSV